MSLVSSLWINSCSTDKVFCQFYEGGRAEVIKLGTQMQTWASWLGALSWGTLRTQQDIQGPLTHPTVKTGAWVRCLQLIGMSGTPRGKILRIFFSKVKRKFPLDCNLQMPKLHPQTIPASVGKCRECSATHHVSTSRDTTWGWKADLQTACAALLLAKCFHSSRVDVPKKTPKKPSSDTPAHHHLSRKVWDL